jgi:uncharacterized damage-inducible protein DinB
MDVNDLLAEAYGRLPELIGTAVRGLTREQLTWAPAPGANTIGWLVWHLTRVQDHHLSELIGTDQVWISRDTQADFDLPPDPYDTGYGHGPEQVAGVRPASAEVLVDYHAAVHDRTLRYLARLTASDLDAVVDRRWDPPVTLGVRLVSVVDDDLQHAGQAGYLRGLLPDV